MNTKVVLYRASILHFPEATDVPSRDYVHFVDGGLVVVNGKILALDEYAVIFPKHPTAEVVDYRGRLIVPGFLDSHLHFPQTEMIAKYGEQLLEWLENYTFPTEDKFKDMNYCRYIAQIFLRQLIDNGTTTALTFASVHSQSVDAMFEAASQLNMAFITGKVCMDRHCPTYLQDTASSAQRQSDDLIQRWHGKGRNLYALTPRFAPTSSPEQLASLGELAQQYPDVFIQTHLSENAHEVAWVKELYPTHTNYLDVYEHFNMVRKRSVFGHCLHLNNDEWAQLSESGAVSAFCPSSNLFLGSGLFDIQSAKEHKVSIALASDVGAGTSFNMLRNYGDAYKISQLQQSPINPYEGLYYMTQGPAIAYDLSDNIGNLNPGSYADFVVLTPLANELSKLRHLGANTTSTATSNNADQTTVENASDMIFALSMIGDDRAVEATYIAGKQQKTPMENLNALA
ncbi:guanine deaminase [Glaciecola petra]|uniref:Guanine deaminase n=1 Tax=Glaciecola petra TaxID=3075602 RepID=A0ABU2ZXQ4_9ALTE|nr:guanine deaminase [Aestuariibacter sp. P117]MDT0596182.1 guanine deaminase [Aestuariibacter sp. P117]